MKLKIGALFAGYGGLDLAVESVIDAEVAWVSEVDAGPSRILAHRYPGIPNHGDVTQIDWTQVVPVDVITGGSPCQDLSHAGKRAGMKDGTRSGLWAAMCDAIETIRPRLVVWENVRGALSAEATAGDVESCEFCVGDDGRPSLRALGRVLGDLAELGYDAAWTGLRAADVGAPHGRWRVFVLAWPADAEGDTWRVLDGDGGAARDAACLGVEGLGAGGLVEPRAHAGEGLPFGAGALPAWGSREWRDLTLLPSPRTSDTNGPGAHGQGGLDLRTAVSLLPTPVVNDMGRAYTPETWDEWTARLKASHGNGNGHGASLSIEALRYGDVFGPYAPTVRRWASLTRPVPQPTEPTGKGGAHRLSPRFVEWMMGLPDGWVTDPAIWEGMKPSTARNAQLKALGNGVVPQQAAAAIRHLLDIRARSAGDPRLEVAA